MLCILTIHTLPPLPCYLVCMWNQKLGFDPYSVPVTNSPAWYIGAEWINGLQQLSFDFFPQVHCRILVCNCGSLPQWSLQWTDWCALVSTTVSSLSLPCCSTLFSNEYFWYMQKQAIIPDVMKSLMILVSNSSGLWCAFLFSIAWHGF